MDDITLIKSERKIKKISFVESTTLKELAKILNKKILKDWDIIGETFFIRNEKDVSYSWDDKGVFYQKIVKYLN